MKKSTIAIVVIGLSLGLSACAKGASEAKTTESESVKNVQDTELSSETKGEGNVDVALDKGIGTYEGDWVDEIAGRGYMQIQPSGDGKYYIEVSWGNSAAEMATWTFTAIYNSETGDLEYDDGKFAVITFDEEGNDNVTEERSVHGKLHNEEGKIFWTDSAYESDEPSVFIRE